MVTVNSWGTASLLVNGLDKITVFRKKILCLHILPLSKEIVCLHELRLENTAIIRLEILCVYTYCMYEIPLLFVKRYSVFRCTPFKKFCYYSLRDTVCLYLFRLENSAIIRQEILYVYTYCIYETLLLFVKRYSMFRCTSFTKLCYYSLRDTVCLHLFHLENSAIIRQEILCVYTYCIYKTLLLFAKRHCVFACTALTNGSYSSEVFVLSCNYFQNLSYYLSEVVCLRVLQ
jgi:hypothetical protein